MKCSGLNFNYVRQKIWSVYNKPEKKKETHWAFVRIGKPWYMYIYIFMKRKFGYDSGPYNFALGQV